METIEIDIPSDAVRLTGTADIRKWLLNQDALKLEQFAIDWIEKYVDKATEFLESVHVEIDDDTFRAATHYEAQTILAIVRPNASCYQFFRDLETLTRSEGRADEWLRREGMKIFNVPARDAEN